MTILRGIGLTGAAGTGKTTFARAVQAEFLRDGQFCVILSFATMLKVEVKKFFELPDEILSPDFDKTTSIRFYGSYEVYCQKNYGKVPRTIRELFQFHGSFRRRQHPNYWTSEAARTLSGIIASNGNQFDEVCVIYDDVRYQNEIDHIRSNFAGGAAVYRLERKINNKVPKHESETQELKIDAIFDLDADTVNMLPVAVRCDALQADPVKRFVRAPGS